LKLGKNILFSELRIFLGYSFDVKIYDLSIYDVFRAFGAWQVLFPASRKCPYWTQKSGLLRISTISSLELFGA